MSYIDDLKTARDRYAATLAAQEAPPDYRWNEYEEFLLAQIEKLNKQIEEATAQEAASAANADSEVISGGYTP